MYCFSNLTTQYNLTVDDIYVSTALHPIFFIQIYSILIYSCTTKIFIVSLCCDATENQMWLMCFGVRSFWQNCFHMSVSHSQIFSVKHFDKCGRLANFSFLVSAVCQKINGRSGKGKKQNREWESNSRNMIQRILNCIWTLNVWKSMPRHSHAFC